MNTQKEMDQFHKNNLKSTPIEDRCTYFLYYILLHPDNSLVEICALHSITYDNLLKMFEQAKFIPKEK